MAAPNTQPIAARNSLKALLGAAALLAVYLGLGPVAGWQGWAAAGRASPVLGGALVLAFGAAFVALVVGLVTVLCRIAAPIWVEALAGGVLGCGFAAARAAHLGPLGDALLMVASVFLGRVVSRMLREPSILVPVAVVAAAVDFWGVYWGFVAHVSKTAPKVTESLSAQVPQMAKMPVEIPMVGAMGVGDFLFLAVFVAAVFRLGLRLRRTYWVLVVTLTAGPTLALLIPQWLFHYELKALPGLPFISLAVLAANWRQVRPSREERLALLYAAATVLAVIGVYVGIRHLVH
jgi:hypothetical protein